MADEGILVAHVQDIPDGEGIKIDADVLGTVDDVALFNDAGEIFALDDTCSHETASLSEGWVENGVVECPLHAGRFDVRTGAATAPPCVDAVKTYPVRRAGDEIQVRLG